MYVCICTIMYVCLCMCIYIYIYTYIYIYIYIYIYDSWSGYSPPVTRRALAVGIFTAGIFLSESFTAPSRSPESPGTL